MNSLSEIQIQWVRLSDLISEVRGTLQREFEYMVETNQRENVITAKKKQIEKIDLLLESDGGFFNALTRAMEQEIKVFALLQFLNVPLDHVNLFLELSIDAVNNIIPDRRDRGLVPECEYKGNSRFVLNLVSDFMKAESGKHAVRIGQLKQFIEAVHVPKQ